MAMENDTKTKANKQEEDSKLNNLKANNVSWYLGYLFSLRIINATIDCCYYNYCCFCESG